MSCPLFVLLVENNLVETPEAGHVAEMYLRPLLNMGIDTLILGCTHYPLMGEVIQKTVGADVALISSAEETTREIREVLGVKGLLNHNGAQPAPRRFFVSGPAQTFQELAGKLLEEEIKAYQVFL